MNFFLNIKNNYNNHTADYVDDPRIIRTREPDHSLVYVEYEVDDLLIDYIKNIDKERFCYRRRACLVIMAVSGEGMQVSLPSLEFFKTIYTNQIQALAKRLGDMAQKILIGERNAAF